MKPKAGARGTAKLAALPLAQRVNEVEAPGFWLLNLHLSDNDKLEVEYEARFGPQSGGTFLQGFVEGSKAGGETLLVPATPNFEAATW